MTLTTWQERLHKHFEGLRRDRSSTVGDEPIFALEHGLEPSELKGLSADIKSHIAEEAPSKDHALPWIVYAAEIGYRYAGDEYWQTFTEETPGWQIYGDRDWLRARFQSFHRQFGGAKPSGPWAKHFSIICWPITHAILPRDLQRQLAEVLYYMRDLFSAELLKSPMVLGKRIAARSWDANSRFQNLTEEPLLIGQIATALLLQGAHGSDSLILPTTLSRIGADLERAQTAREWLRGAQRVAQQRVHFHGLSSGTLPVIDTGPVTGVERAREQVAALAIEPGLILRPTSEESWDVLLEFPDLSHLLVRFPALRGVLTESRCVVAGSSGRPLPRGALLHGSQQVILRTWPRPTEILLRFEQPVPPECEYLLRVECLLRPGPLSLFRIASDRLAYGLRGNFVRPGQSYVLARSSGPFELDAGMTPVRLACEGIHGARFDVPTAISGEWAGRLQTLGLNQAKSIQVWPAGLAAASWDGQGRAEWLTSERPCIGVRSDHALDAITVTLGIADTQRLEVVSPTPGLPVFVELPPLAVGVHRLRVAARVGRSGEEQAGELDVMIREPRVWAPGMGGPGALRINVDPPAPTLEEVWEGRVAIDIRGPAGRQIIPIISLFGRRTSVATIRKRLPPLAIPADADAWRSHFQRHFRDARDVQQHYDPAHVCHLELNAEELGRASLTCEREFSPLRWVVRRRGPAYELSLLDDSGSPNPPDVSRYEFTAPDNPVRLDTATFLAGCLVPPTGGLYRVCAAQFERAVILPPAGRGLTLQELNVAPQIRRRPRAASAVEELLSLVRLWSGARLTGLFSATRRQTVLTALLQEIFAIVGGENWVNAERALRFQDGGAVLEALRRAVSSQPLGVRLATALLQDCDAYALLGTSDRVVRFRLIARRLLQMQDPPPIAVAGSAGGATLFRRPSGPANPDWICEFALRLASSPAGLETWAGDHLRKGVERLLESPILARAARFLVMAVDRHSQAPAAMDGRLYRAWGWDETPHNS